MKTKYRIDGVELGVIVRELADLLAEAYGEPKTDQGAFDSEFCWKLEELIESTFAKKTKAKAE